MQVAATVSGLVTVLAGSFVLCGLFGKGFQRLTGVTNDELRNDPIFRSDRMALFVRLLPLAVRVSIVAGALSLVFAVLAEAM